MKQYFQEFMSDKYYAAQFLRPLKKPFNFPFVYHDISVSPTMSLKHTLLFFCFNWNLFHARLDSHYEAWSYKKKKHKKIKVYWKSV